LCVPRVNFFFSSRRRHTRSKRDWSSDVCSSDLAGGSIPLSRLHKRPQFSQTRRIDNDRTEVRNPAPPKKGSVFVAKAGARMERRSEERRVGKERRYRRGR